MSAAARRFSAFVGLFIERELSKYMLSVQSPAQTIGANARTERAFFNFGANAQIRKYAAEPSASNVISAGSTFAFVNRYARRER